MSDPLHDLEKAAHSTPVGHSTSFRRPTSGPPMEMIVLIGLGVLVVMVVVFYPFLRSSPQAPAEPEPQPTVVVPGGEVKWPEPKRRPPVSDDATPARPAEANVAATPARAADGDTVPPATQPVEEDWTIQRAVTAKVVKTEDGRIAIEAHNKSPRTVVNVFVDPEGGDELLGLPPIPPGKTLRLYVKDAYLLRAAKEDHLPKLTIDSGEFAP